MSAAKPSFAIFEHTFIEYLLMYCHADGARNVLLGDRRPVGRGIAVREITGARGGKARKCSRERGLLSIADRRPAGVRFYNEFNGPITDFSNGGPPPAGGGSAGPAAHGARRARGGRRRPRDDRRPRRVRSRAC